MNVPRMVMTRMMVAIAMVTKWLGQSQKTFFGRLFHGGLLLLLFGNDRYIRPLIYLLLMALFWNIMTMRLQNGLTAI